MIHVSLSKSFLVVRRGFILRQPKNLKDSPRPTVRVGPKNTGWLPVFPYLFWESRSQLVWDFRKNIRFVNGNVYGFWEEVPMTFESLF
jgi:hypothetical protein